MKAVDTSVLVYAEMRGSEFHARAATLLTELAAGPEPWALPWHCAYEFLRIVTHPRIYEASLSIGQAEAELFKILESPSVRVISETERHRAILERVLSASKVTGSRVHDARIFAICLDHGVSELFSGDADFHRFEGLKVTNPFRA